MLLGGHHPSALPEAGEEDGAEYEAQHLCLPRLQEQNLGPVTDEDAVFAAKKQLSEIPKEVSDTLRGLQVEPREAENGQNALVACPGVSGAPRGVG